MDHIAEPVYYVYIYIMCVYIYVACSLAKYFLRNASSCLLQFMMWMSGSGVGIFSIMWVLSLYIYHAILRAWAQKKHACCLLFTIQDLVYGANEPHQSTNWHVKRSFEMSSVYLMTNSDILFIHQSFCLCLRSVCTGKHHSGLVEVSGDVHRNTSRRPRPGSIQNEYHGFSANQGATYVHRAFICFQHLVHKN